MLWVLECQQSSEDGGEMGWPRARAPTRQHPIAGIISTAQEKTAAGGGGGEGTKEMINTV